MVSKYPAGRPETSSAGWCRSRTRGWPAVSSRSRSMAAAEKSVQFSKVVKMARDIDVGVEFTLGI